MNLFVNYYIDKSGDRNAELITALHKNLDCAAISKVYLIADSELWMDKVDSKIFQINQQTRPTFRDFFNIINRFTQPNDINIIANSDIYFDEVDYNHFTQLGHNDCYALSRWDVNAEGTATHYNNSGSQDTWIFRGAIKMVEQCNFTQGVAGCDNKIAWCLQQAGYNVTNPSKSIKTYHLHLSGVRYYDKPKKGVGIYRLPKPRVNVPIT